MIPPNRCRLQHGGLGKSSICPPDALWQFIQPQNIISFLPPLGSFFQAILRVAELGILGLSLTKILFGRFGAATLGSGVVGPGRGDQRATIFKSKGDNSMKKILFIFLGLLLCCGSLNALGIKRARRGGGGGGGQAGAQGPAGANATVTQATATVTIAGGGVFMSTWTPIADAVYKLPKATFSVCGISAYLVQASSIGATMFAVYESTVQGYGSNAYWVRFSPQIVVTTNATASVYMSTSFTIPDLSRFGIGIDTIPVGAGSMPYGWGVTLHGLINQTNQVW